MGLLLQSFLIFPFLLLLAAAANSAPITSNASEGLPSCSVDFFEPGEASGGVFLTLHHAHGPCSPLDQPAPTASEILRHDTRRVNHLISRLFPANRASTNLHHRISSATLSRWEGEEEDTGRTSKKPSSAGSVPLSSGMSLGVGNYVTKIGLGSPAREYVVVVDTGSSLSWIQCRPCKVSCHAQSGPTFDPKSSRTYRPVSCSEAECGALEKSTLNPSSCSKKKVCIYEASYGDGSFSVGYLGRDALSIGRSKTQPSFVYGCGQDNEGLFGKAAGLVGLAKDKLSMLGQLSAQHGQAFSYCLPSTSSSGYLSLGSFSADGYAFTPMVPNPSDASLYYLRLSSITVAQKRIPAPASDYSSTPTLIDSGTVITRLPSSVYSALSKAVAASLAGHARAPGYSILDTCFKGSRASLPVPPVSLVFDGGAEMKLPPQNVFYDLKSEGITCLAFAESYSVAIVGNQQQQTFSVAYDVAKSRIGFAGGGCK